MATEPGERIYALEEFLTEDLPPDENGNDQIEYELVEGKLVPNLKGAISGKYGKMVSVLDSSLRVYAKKNQLGEVFAGASCTLGSTDPKASWVVPDVCFVAEGRLPDEFDGPIPVAPDLVVEVNSPSDTTLSSQTKIEGYQRAGVGLVWSVYLLAKFVIVYRLNDPDTKLFNLYSGELDADPVLPGLKLRVKALFE